MTNIFFGIPSDCITQLLTEWLTLQDLGQIDVAVANGNQRVSFEQEISRNEFILNNMARNSASSSLYKWILLHSVKVRWLEVNSALPSEEVGGLFKLQQSCLEKVFVCSAIEQVENQLVQFIPECPLLTSCHLMAIKTCPNSLNCMFQRLVNPSRLMNISFCSCPGVTFEVLLNLASTSPNIQRLVLNSCFSIVDQPIDEPCGFTQLQNLITSNCESLGDQTLRLLTSKSTGLTALELTCNNITDAGLTFLTTSVSKLKSLRIEEDEGSKGCTTKGVNKLVNCSPQLELLDLDCDGSYQDILISIVKNCPKFHSLILYERSETESLTDRELKEFTEKTPKLKKCNRYLTVESEAPSLIHQ